ncbi:hypothetical protein Pta6605_55710 [Pseudomonas amygdali pv. tabaci]|nr:hypothetical protein Pta6605_55710 [Pseudomonas amygdali pv. tabaci]
MATHTTTVDLSKDITDDLASALFAVVNAMLAAFWICVRGIARTKLPPDDHGHVSTQEGSGR